MLSSRARGIWAAVVLTLIGCEGGIDPGPDGGGATEDAARFDAGVDVADAGRDAGGGDAGRGRATVILHDFIAGPTPIPTWVRDRLAYLRTTPFDGIVVYMRAPDVTNNISATTMRAVALDPVVVADVLAPMPEIVDALPGSLVLVLNQKPGDLFDDAAWGTAAANFGVLARVLRDHGVRGVFFDNEEYGERWGDWEAGSGRTLDESLAQARARGREIMAAMVAEYPDIAVLTLHGPYISEPDAPIPPFEGPFWEYNELLGAFFAGFVEGAGDRAPVIDGGEIYTLRTAETFAATYEFREHGIASDTVDSAFIPPALRPLWSPRVEISFGLYDQPYRGEDMSPAIMETTLAHALDTTDRFVWVYTEGRTLLEPGLTADPWLTAIRNARAATSR